MFLNFFVELDWIFLMELYEIFLWNRMEFYFRMLGINFSHISKKFGIVELHEIFLAIHGIYLDPFLHRNSGTIHLGTTMHVAKYETYILL